MDVHLYGALFFHLPDIDYSVDINDVLTRGCIENIDENGEIQLPVIKVFNERDQITIKKEKSTSGKAIKLIETFEKKKNPAFHWFMTYLRDNVGHGDLADLIEATARKMKMPKDAKTKMHKDTAATSQTEDEPSTSGESDADSGIVVSDRNLKSDARNQPNLTQPSKTATKKKSKSASDREEEEVARRNWERYYSKTDVRERQKIYCILIGLLIFVLICVVVIAVCLSFTGAFKLMGLVIVACFGVLGSLCCCCSICFAG